MAEKPSSGSARFSLIFPLSPVLLQNSASRTPPPRQRPHPQSPLYSIASPAIVYPFLIYPFSSPPNMFRTALRQSTRAASAVGARATVVSLFFPSSIAPSRRQFHRNPDAPGSVQSEDTHFGPIDGGDDAWLSWKSFSSR